MRTVDIPGSVVFFGVSVTAPVKATVVVAGVLVSADVDATCSSQPGPHPVGRLASLLTWEGEAVTNAVPFWEGPLPGGQMAATETRWQTTTSAWGELLVPQGRPVVREQASVPVPPHARSEALPPCGTGLPPLVPSRRPKGDPGAFPIL